MSLQAVIRFAVIDESDDWLVVDKPAPLLVHPTNLQDEPTLLGGIENLLVYDIANGARPAVVNRLDRDTSGLLLVAKHPQAARELGMAFQERQTLKEYHAIVTGWPEDDEWECHEPIIRAGEVEASTIWVRQRIHPQGKPCCSRFRVESRFVRDGGRFALIRCFPHTGRMHQLRVHLAHAGFPIVGDKIYADHGAGYLEWLDTGWTPTLQRRLHLPRHALHATHLALPWRGRSLAWQVGLAKDLLRFMAGLHPEDAPEVVIWSRSK